MRGYSSHAVGIVMTFALAGCVFDPAGASGDDGAADRADATPGAPDARPLADADVPRADAPPPCPAGWAASGSSCYLVVAQMLAWDAARAACEQAQAHLVIIDDADENERVRALATRFPRWLGATDAANEGTWLWVDGTPAGFTDWALFQPDNFLLNEDCAQQAADGSWNDQDCSGAAAFVCERAASSE
jgi:hypothetical protein